MMNAINRPFLASSCVIAGVLAATIALHAGQSPAPAPSQAPQGAAPPAAAPNDDKNAAIYTRVCSTCHEPERILSNRRTRDQWGEVIDKMVERGAQGSDEDLDAVLEYLVSHYGRVNLNRATSEDLAAVLKLTEKDAEAVVAYRTENGPFSDFDALLKVPGIDPETLKRSREAMTF